MMSKQRTSSRRILVAMVKAKVLPQLHARGFSAIPQRKEPIPMWDFNRPRPDGGYDVISVIFDEKWSPRFYAIINIVEPAGVSYPWGESIPPQRVTAATLLDRVFVRKKNVGILALLFPRWFSHTWFGCEPQKDANTDTREAERACEAFVACLDEAEHWWRTGELGPHLTQVTAARKRE